MLSLPNSRLEKVDGIDPDPDGGASPQGQVSSRVLKLKAERLDREQSEERGQSGEARYSIRSSIPPMME